eukprot:jgi/Tetstr1/428476/TSEL_018487.t1
MLGGASPLIVGSVYRREMHHRHLIVHLLMSVHLLMLLLLLPLAKPRSSWGLFTMTTLPVIPGNEGVRATMAREVAEAQCIRDILRAPYQQCVHACFAGDDGIVLTDTELEALQRASACRKLLQSLSGCAHVHSAYDILADPRSNKVNFKNIFSIGM